jgi:hypothetical protein
MEYTKKLAMMFKKESLFIARHTVLLYSIPTNDETNSTE